MKYKHIHSRNVKNKLVEMGHKVIDEERNKKMEKFFIYIFEETPQLLEDLTKITNEIRKSK